MSVFGNYAPGQVADAAQKFISKMDERELATALEQSARAMSSASRAMLVEAIFDAFRHRGESSEDAVEGAGTALGAARGGEESAVFALLQYAKNNPGLLKEAAVSLIQEQPLVVAELGPALSDGIALRLSQH